MVATRTGGEVGEIADSVVVTRETLADGDEAAVASGRPGANTIGIALRVPAGAPLDAADLSMEVANPAAAVETLARRPERLEPGPYRLEGGEPRFAGEWTIDLRTRIGDFDEVAFRIEVAMR